VEFRNPGAGAAQHAAIPVTAGQAAGGLTDACADEPAVKIVPGTMDAAPAARLAGMVGRIGAGSPLED
jgi:hypothetical protein